MAKKDAEKASAWSPARRPPAERAQGREDEHRDFPRIDLKVPVRAWMGTDARRTFNATFQMGNVSVSGAFLASTFFLPMGAQLSIGFQVEKDGDEVLVRAEIVREERTEGRSGFGVRFVEFLSQSDLTLAKLFLGEQLETFAHEYLQSKRAKSIGNELERVVDALAAWELRRVNDPEHDPWGR